MSPADQSTSKTGASTYTSDKPQAAPPSPPKTTRQPTAKPATITASKRSVAEINYPDPLPGGFQPGKKSLLF